LRPAGFFEGLFRPSRKYRRTASGAKRLADFNASVVSVVGQKRAVTISKRDEFEELKESNVIDIAGHANLFSANTKKILKIQLDKRNLAAHPSLVEIHAPQADDTISSLVNNVVLVLK
jgi:hypothetical protein